MTVIHVTESLCTGVLSAIEGLASAQQRAGLDVRVVYTRRDETPSEAELARRLPDIALVPVPGGRLGGLVNLYRTVDGLLGEHRQPSIVHLHSSFAGLLRASPLVLRARTFYSPHAYGFLRPSAPPVTAAARVVERLLARAPATTIAVSSSELALAVRLGARDPRMLENRVCIIEEPPQGSESHRLPSDRRLRVLSVGRATPQKRPEWVAAIAGTCGDVATFEWIGDGPLRRQVQVRGISWHATMSRKEVVTRMASSDVFLLTSAYEGLSVALVEAMVSGLVPVVSDIAGNRDVIVHGVNGLIAPDPDGLASCLRELSADPALRARLSSQARRSAYERFVDPATFDRDWRLAYAD